MEISKESGKKPVNQLKKTKCLTEDGAHLEGVVWPEGLTSRPLKRELAEYQRIIEELRDSEEKYRNIVENSPDLMYIVDLQWVVRSINKASKTILGYEPEEVIGHNFMEFISRDAAQQMAEDYRQILTGEKIVNETVITRKDGEKRYLEFISVPIIKDGSVAEVQGFAHDVTHRRQAEKLLRIQQQQLQTLSSQLLQTEEQERRCLAIDLHDGIGQSLATIKIKLQSMALSSSDSPIVKELLDLADKAITSTRTLTFDLSPTILYEEGLEAGLEYLLEKFHERYGLRYLYAADGQQKPINEEINILLYRIVSELLMNIIKHAKAKSVRLEVKQEDSQISITITDDGLGFDVNEAWERKAGLQGFGLLSIRERLNWVGGTFTIQSKSGYGTTATIKASLKQETEEN